MARMTKAQREAEAAVAAAARDAENAQNYRADLFELLHIATSRLNWEITPLRTQKLLVEDRNDRNLNFLFPLDFDTDSTQVRLEKFRFEVEYQVSQQEEAERKYLVKQAALAKLSVEERTLLGLQ